jgi:MraZ protein
MVKFIGEYTVKVDDKGRLILPSSFKSVITNGDLRFVVKRGLFFNCLEMFTYEEWANESEQVKSRLNFFNREHSQFWREYMRDRALVEPDEKLGRISIPKRLLEQIGVGKEVIFAGNDHKIEIWAKENFQNTKLQESDYIALAEKILG